MPQESSEDWYELIAEQLAEVFGMDPEQVERTTKLEDLGLDSLAFAELVVSVEQQLDRRLPDGLLRPDMTLGEVADAIARGAAMPVQPAQ